MPSTDNPGPSPIHEPAAFWDAKYAGAEYFYGTEANAWLRAQAERLAAGMSALAIADGEGRNGVWLAERGLTVTAVDVSPRALAKAAALARERGVAVELVEADLRSWAWPEARYDVAVAIFAHFPPEPRREIHRRVLRALRPGGLVILEAYSPYQRIYQTGGPADLDLLYTAYRLQQDFAGAEILHLEETLTELAEGSGHRGTSAVTRLLARRAG
jgi:SAM-dependent methyltransferase